MDRVQYKLMLSLAFGALVLGFVGCSKSSDSPAGPIAATIVPGTGIVPGGTDGTGYNPTDFDGTGQSVAFVPSSFAEFNSYVGTHPLNNPTNFKINIKLSLVSGTYLLGGAIKIGYTDNGSWFQGTFKTGLSTNVKCSGCDDNGSYEASYNYFFMSEGKRVFTGYFQDRYGAIVLVLEPATGSGDGDGGTYKGSVYYKNFAQSLAPQSPYRQCWFIKGGPYTCGSYAVHTKSSITNIDQYTKLGTFTGIDVAKIQQ